MKYRIFTTSIKAWAGMLADIEAAKRSIYLQMYILGNDNAGLDFFGALEKAARRGIRVIVILDVMSLDIWAGNVSRLREAGAEVLYSSFWFQRMHRKILVVDETVAYTGGVNIAREFSVWRDLMIRVTGSVLGPILRSFFRVYQACGGADKELYKKRKINDGKRAGMSFVDHGIGKRRNILRRYYEERISGAKQSLTLVTPYFFPPRWFIALLHQAVIRGVKIDILLPETSAGDHPFASSVNSSYAKVLTDLGARVYLSPVMNHAKAMLIDEREGIIGSQNIDILSFNVNLEAGVFFKDPDMVRQLSLIIKDWKKDAVVFDPKGAKFHWYDVPVGFLLRLLGFIPM